MSELDLNSIKNLSDLCRIACSDDEAESILADLNQTLDFIQKLQDLDTENVRPCYQVQDHLENVFRDDRVSSSYPRDEFLNNAPAQVGGMIRVPPVIEANK